MKKKTTQILSFGGGAFHKHKPRPELAIVRDQIAILKQRMSHHNRCARINEKNGEYIARERHLRAFELAYMDLRKVMNRFNLLNRIMGDDRNDRLKRA